MKRAFRSVFGTSLAPSYKRLSGDGWPLIKIQLLEADSIARVQPFEVIFTLKNNEMARFARWDTYGNAILRT